MAAARRGQDGRRVLRALDLEKHPDKTFIGRIECGFDFLGYRFTRAGLSVARKTIENFLEKASRLYEQECGAAPPATALEMYVKMGPRNVGVLIRRRTVNNIANLPSMRCRGESKLTAMGLG